MKTVFAISALALTVVLGMPGQAEARDFRLYLGIPHYGYRVGPEYRFRDGYGWYNPDYRMRQSMRLSCSEARREVRRSGFRNINVIECAGRTYTFRATRNGYRQVIYVNSRTGEVWR